MRGYKWSPAQREKLQGRTLSAERRERLSMILKAKGMTRSPETRAQIAATRKARGIRPAPHAHVMGGLAFGAIRKTLPANKQPAWKRGYYVEKNGRRYVLVAPDTYVPNANLVMEKLLGRRLVPPEMVHYIDENPGNDDPANLLLLPSRGAHMRLHRQKV